MTRSNKSTDDKNRLCAAVMGCGQWGRNWVRVLADDEKTDLKWVIDPDPGARRRARAIAPHVRTSSSIDETLDDADLVVVSTPALDHFAHVLRLLHAKKHVLVEKPMAMDTRRARELKAVAEANSVTLMVGHQLLFHPAFVRLRSLVRAGALGRLRAIRAKRTGPVDFDREPDVIWSYGPHDVAMILALLPGAPTEISVSKERYWAPNTPNSVHIDLGFETGLTAEIDLDATDADRTRRFVVVGDGGTAVFDDSSCEGRLFLLDREPFGEPDAHCEIEIDFKEPLAVEYAQFIDSVLRKVVPIAGSDHAVEVTRILDQVSQNLSSSDRCAGENRAASRFSPP